MKRILKFFAASIAALALVTVLVSATVSESKMASVSLSSKAYPALDCSLPLSQAQGIFVLLPANVKDMAKVEYRIVRDRFSQKKNFTYKGVKCHTLEDGDGLNITFTYDGYTISVKNTTWEELDGLFD